MCHIDSNSVILITEPTEQNCYDKISTMNFILVRPSLCSAREVDPLCPPDPFHLLPPAPMLCLHPEFPLFLLPYLDV